MTTPQLTQALVRLGGGLCCLWVFWAAKTVWIIGQELSDRGALVLSMLGFSLFFLLAFETFSTRLPSRYVTHVMSVLFVTILLYGQAFASYLHEGVGTDELFFSIAAGKELVAGRNPYGEDLTSYVPSVMGKTVGHGFFTRSVSGPPVSTLPYPALSVLLYLPSVVFHLSPSWIGYAAFILALATLVAVAPPGLRTLAPLAFFVNPAALEYVNTGVEDILYVAPLLLAAYFWTEMPVFAGLMLGTACSVKQVPWLDVPFFVLGVYAAASGGIPVKTRKAMFAALGVAVSFAAFNIAFFAGKPASWTLGILQPFTGKYVEFGIGLVSLNLYGGSHVPREAFTAAMIALLAVFVVLGYRFFPQLRNALWLVPGLALFVAPRSLENYFMYLIPVAAASWFGQLPEALAAKARLIERLRASALGRLLAA